MDPRRPRRFGPVASALALARAGGVLAVVALAAAPVATSVTSYADDPNISAICFLPSDAVPGGHPEFKSVPSFLSPTDDAVPDRLGDWIQTECYVVRQNVDLPHLGRAWRRIHGGPELATVVWFTRQDTLLNVQFDLPIE